MKTYQLVILLIFVHVQLFAQTECEKELAKMFDENKKVKLDLQDAETALQKIEKLLKIEQDLRIRAEKELANAQKEITRLQTELNFKNEQISALNSNIDKLRTERDRLKQRNDTLSADYQKLVLEIDKRNSEITRLTDAKEENQRRFKEREQAIGVWESKVKQLEDEQSDRISSTEQMVYFKGAKYSFGTEIFFVKSTAGRTVVTIDNETLETLKRFVKLINKYDYKVKISLEGKSCDEGSGDRKEYATDRAKDLLIYLTQKFENNEHTEYKFTDTQFSKVVSSKEQVARNRVGVSVRIVKK
jgi:DNA repair exonuclease SbcCD ATPase subunit